MDTVANAVMKCPATMDQVPEALRVRREGRALYNRISSFSSNAYDQQENRDLTLIAFHEEQYVREEYIFSGRGQDAARLHKLS